MGTFPSPSEGSGFGSSPFALQVEVSPRAWSVHSPTKRLNKRSNLTSPVEWVRSLRDFQGEAYPRRSMGLPYMPTLAPPNHPNVGQYGSPMERLGIEEPFPH